MSNRNRNSSRSTTTVATPVETASSATSTRSSTRGSAQTTQQKTTQAVSNAASTSTPRRPRKPVVIRVRSTGEEIRRVPVERSGYRVVRYEGRYHTVRGNRAAPYIFGAEDSNDVLGRA